MTPDHQHLVDTLLWHLHRWVEEGVRDCQYPLGKHPPAQTIKQMRSSPIGQHLAALATYAEGYPYPFEEDVRLSAGIVSRSFFGDPFDPKGSRLPPKFHRTPLGRLINEALSRFFSQERPGTLLSVKEVRRRFGVTRQAAHEWIQEGHLYAVYLDGSPRIYAQDAERYYALWSRHKSSS
jgi:hypothetical protein